MQPAGWYSDPAGVPGRHRYWDGQQWREEVTFDPTAPPPDTPGVPPTGQYGPGPAGTPRTAGPRSRVPVSAAIVGVVVILAVVLAVAIPRLLRPEAPTDPTDPPIQPTATVTPGTGDLNCAGGNGVAAGTAGTHAESTGAAITTPSDWPFHFDLSQWSWLDDQTVFGKSPSEVIELAAFGGLSGANGFVEPEAATEQIVTCLNRYGIYNDHEYPQEEVSSEAIEIGGMSGWQRVVDFDEGDTTTRATIIVVDSGQPNRLVSLTTFAAPGSPSEDVVAAVAESLTKL